MTQARTAGPRDEGIVAGARSFDRNGRAASIEHSFSGPFEHSFSDPFARSLRDPTARRPRRPRGRIPGEIGIWVFIVGDMLIFGLFFVVFVAQRAQHPTLFEHSRATLNLTFGAVNTLLLLTGSMFVVQALHALRRQAERLAPRLLGAAMLCGLAFIVNKVFEYHAEVHAGHTPTANDFYTFYFMFTGLHLLHLCIGMVFLTIALRVSRKPRLAARDMRTIEVSASFWHLVDLLWIVLFPLLYLIR